VVYGISITAELFDPRNPLTAYIYLAITAMTIRFALIIRPLHRAYVRFNNKGILKRLLRIKKDSALTGIEGFLIVELSLLTVPITVAAILRFVVGTPEAIEWNRPQFYFGIGIGLIWLLADLNRSLKTRNALKPLEQWYANPRAISFGLDSVTWTRARLDSLSKLTIQPPEQIEVYSPDLQEVIQRDDEGKLSSIDTEALKTNLGELGKTAATAIRRSTAAAKTGLKSVAEQGRSKIDMKLQTQVDELTAVDGWRYYTLVYNIILVFTPLLIVYYVLPSMG
jgi:hypothetical protein